MTNMKKILFLLVLAVGVLTSCDIDSTRNGNLDGFWVMQRIDTLATGGSADVHARQPKLTYSVSAHLLQLRGADREILCRFSLTADSLILSDPYYGGWCQPDNEVKDVEMLQPYGINRIEEHFHIEALDSKKMILASKELRLYFRKY